MDDWDRERRERRYREQEERHNRGELRNRGYDRDRYGRERWQRERLDWDDEGYRPTSRKDWGVGGAFSRPSSRSSYETSNAPIRRTRRGRYEQQDDYDLQRDADFYGYDREEVIYSNEDPDVRLRREAAYRWRPEYGDQPHFEYGRYGQRYQSREQEEADRRGWWDKTSDEVASWFGDEEAARRRRLDAARAGHHRGRGPKNYTRSDSRIEEDINDRLTDHDFLDAYDIDVKVTNAEVVLTGNVPDRYSKFLAEEISQQVSGVRNVENRLRIDRDKTAPLAVEPGRLEAREVSTGKAATTKNV